MLESSGEFGLRKLDMAECGFGCGCGCGWLGDGVGWKSGACWSCEALSNLVDGLVG